MKSAIKQAPEPCVVVDASVHQRSVLIIMTGMHRILHLNPIHRQRNPFFFPSEIIRVIFRKQFHPVRNTVGIQAVRFLANPLLRQTERLYSRRIGSIHINRTRIGSQPVIRMIPPARPFHALHTLVRQRLLPIIQPIRRRHKTTLFFATSSRTEQVSFFLGEPFSSDREYPIPDDHFTKLIQTT